MKYFLYIIASVVMQAFSYGYVSRTMDRPSNLLFVILAFLSCTVFYFLLARKQKQNIKKKDIAPLALLNIGTAVAFVAFYASISLTQASVASLVEAAVGPLWIVIFSRSLRNGSGQWRELAVATIVLACAVFSATTTMQTYTIADGLGLALALMAGGGAALVAIWSRKADALGISPQLILAHRFHGTYLVALALLMFHGGVNIDASHLARDFLIACFGVVGPMYLLQLGMQRCEPIATMLCLSVVPLATYGFELALGGAFHWSTLLFLSLGVTCSSTYLIFKGSFERRNAKQALGASPN